MSSLFTNAEALALAKSAASTIPYLKAAKFSDDDLRSAVFAAEAEVARRLRVFLQPTEIWPSPPGVPADTAGVEEPAYDYDPGGFRGDRWGWITLRQHPVIRVDSVIFAYPAAGFPTWTIPSTWLRVEAKAGIVQIVPTGSTFNMAPLGAWLLQLMGSGHVVPGMVRVRYAAGLSNAKSEWPDLINAIRQSSLALLALTAMVPQSGSLSLDGLSESSSFDVGKFQDAVDRLLFGPPGVNGGLWTAIHGVSVGFLG